MTPYEFTIMAALWLSVSFFGGFVTHAVWLGFIARRALRQALEQMFMDAHLGASLTNTEELK